MQAVIGLLIGAMIAVGSSAAETESPPAIPFSAQDLVQLQRISDIRASPDGSHVSFTVRSTDMQANTGRTHIWSLDVKSRGSKPRQLTDGAFNDSASAWSSDSKVIYFLSERSGSTQVWRMGADGEAPTQVTRLPLDAGSFRISPRQDRLLVSVDVFIDCADLSCTAARLDRAKQHVASGRDYERIFARHWDTWSDGRRSQLFSMPLDAAGIAWNTPVNLSNRLDGDVPRKPFGGSEDYALSSDGQAVVFSIRLAPAGEPWSTNFDVFEVPVGGGTPRNLTAGNRGEDVRPAYSPDGQWISYLAADRPGFESDRLHVVLLNRKSGEKRALANDWDVSIGGYEWSRDGKSLLVSASHHGQKPLWSVDSRTGNARAITTMGNVESFSSARERVYYVQSDLGHPGDLYSSGAGGKALRLTEINRERLGALSFGAFEQFEFPGARGEPVFAYLVQPANFKAGQRYPLAVMIRELQGNAANEWDWRWNAQSIAGAGFGVLMIDFHGSTGYGQRFTDSISKDWGGAPFQDIKLGVSAALARYSWIDGARKCALGGSYGGYMTNWIAGEWPDGFKCLVTHSGIFDMRSMYYSTDELWRPEWENGGPEYQNAGSFARFNPLDHVSGWKTPMLVTHGEHDFRVPFVQGLEAFTALQRRGIPSELLVFPDENHWILNPANSMQWYETVIAWMNRWTRGPP